MAFESELSDWSPAFVVAAVFVLAWLDKWYRRKPIKDPPIGTPYKIYTAKYDIEIRAEQISSQLEKIGTHLAEYWRPDGDPEWEEAVAGANADAQKIEQAGFLSDLPLQLNDFAISLLIDHSGSMKGHAMRAVAPVAKSLTNILSEKGAKVELLGYTTAGWHGGFARQEWLHSGRPKRPGRLCALMHVVYKVADDIRLDDEAFKVMLNPGILYENVDGESIEWAERRLLARPESNKLLIVLSDGAPVDDSTLTYNGPSILWRHIRHVIARIEAGNTVTLAAIGINYRVDEFYALSATAEELTKLPSVAERLLIETINSKM